MKKAAAKKKATKKTTKKKSVKKATRSKTKATTDERKTPPKRPTRIRVRESAEKRKERALQILNTLRKEYPNAVCALHHRSAYELLVSTILSAQCTDERVNQVTPNLFRLYPDATMLAKADQDDLEAAIRSTGFFRNKAKSLLGMARLVVEQFAGEIPDSMDELLTLPGVARKTANCVLGTWFEKNEGIVVDTHVGRLALRLGMLTTARDDKDAVKIERDLSELFPNESWTYLSHALIEHGRNVCQARKPKCNECSLAGECPSVGSF